MSHPSVAPYAAIALSSVTYSIILRLLSSNSQGHQYLKVLIKAVSAGHSTFTTLLTVISLCQPWPTDTSRDQWGPSPKPTSNYARLDDSQNPLITGKNTLAGFVTAWEAGYLIYDTGAIFLVSYATDASPHYRAALARLFRTSPVSIAHHTLLAAALFWLQTYLAVGREKGLRIIMAFFLMNASTPLLHLRWWRRNITGRSSIILDAALALVFAVTRFGSIYWVIEKYGQYHTLTPWQAIRRQRWICQVGTGTLVTLNAIWWLGLIRQMGRRKVRRT